MLSYPQVAARTLGDIVRKLGEKVLPEIIPILERGLESEESDQRQGVCIGLSEIMSSTSREHVLIYADSLVPTVSKALIDPLPEVREAAADTFSNLHANIGQRALEDILPALLRKLNDPELSEYALDGLKQVMAVKSRVVLPMLVPQLTAPPVNTRALSFLASVAGVALNNHLHRILPSLMSALADKIGTPDEQQELQYSQSVVLSIADDAGTKILMDELLMAMNSTENTTLHCASVTIMHTYCAHTKSDYSDYMPLLFRGILRLFTYTDEHVLNASWMCLNAITKKLGNSEMLGHIANVRQALRFAVSDFHGDELPGFCLPGKGITPILPIFREGILNGPPEMKESSAIGLGEVIKRTSAAALRPSVVHITGPLIRILGDRFSYGVKVALLETLALLLGKCGAMLKPFLPQLQTTFIKALNDPHRTVRLKAALALGHLAVIHTRVDPLFTELHSGVKNTEDQAVRETMLQALRGCITGAGPKMGDKVRKELATTLESLLFVTPDVARTTAAASLGSLCKVLSEEELMLLLNLHLLDTDTGLEWTVRHGRSVALSIALKEAAERLMVEEWSQRVVETVLTNASADRVPICLSGLRGVGYLICHQVVSGGAITPSLITALIKTMKHDSNDVKQLGAQVVSYIAQSAGRPLDITIIRTFVPMLVNGTKEKNTVVKTSSESALVSLLRLRTDDSTLQMTLNALESGMKDALNEVMTKTLRKMASLPELRPDDIDDTVLV
ncbi:eIF-2-alpha kinase activator GCN1 [Lamellibrachia satsuma]|nr:eIF-2-alpha kinase activator GCN1 [Lamellibrachia satsuma]